MTKYVKKPVEVEAFQWNGEPIQDYPEWVSKYIQIDDIFFSYKGSADSSVTMKIRTLEGVMTASKGDYIIQGVHGEIYPCKPDIFAKTYEIA